MKIVTYYDRHFKTWVAFFVDGKENQVGDCEYHVNKKQCIENLLGRGQEEYAMQGYWEVKDTDGIWYTVTAVRAAAYKLDGVDVRYVAIDK